jgi:hypothetical protein
MGRYQEGIPLAQRALAITEKARGPEHPETAVRASMPEARKNNSKLAEMLESVRTL